MWPKRPAIRLAFAAALFLASVAVAQSPADGPWTGHVKCGVEPATQTWTLSGDGALRIEGAMRVYAATWSAGSGGPQPTLLAIFIRASDKRLIFRQWGNRVGAGIEWNFGWIDASAADTHVVGSRPGAQGPCEWEFDFGTTPARTIAAISAPEPVLGPAPATLARPGNANPLRKAPLYLRAPADLAVQITANQGAWLSWSPVPGASAYRVEGSGVDPKGQTVSATGQSAVMLSNVPSGASSWSVFTVDSQGQWDANQAARVTAMVRGLPNHTPAFLTKNNGAGGMATTMAHYAGACGSRSCPIGASFFDVVAALGISREQMLADTLEWDPLHELGGRRRWRDSDEAVYLNVTEFNTPRHSRCWNAPGQGNLVCYANSEDHGLSLIYLQPPNAWFMQFEGVVGYPVFEMGEYDKIQTRYKLVATQTFDRDGPKFAPHVCLACHGGRFDAATGKVTGATLLPIDRARIRDYGRNVDLINRAILQSGAPVNVAAFIQGLYGGRALDPDSTANRDYVPAGWASQPDLYRQVVRPYCIACHLHTPANIDFSTAGKFMARKTEILNSVCNAHSMPHAQIPFKDFWTRDTGAVYLPGFLSAALGGGECR